VGLTSPITRGILVMGQTRYLSPGTLRPGPIGTYLRSQDST